MIKDNSTSKINLREENLKVFKKEPLEQVFFQPRIDYWYAYNKERGTLPKKYEKMTILEVYDDLDISIRYFHYYTGSPIGIKYSEGIKVEEKKEGNKMYTIYHTPKGELVKEWTYSETIGGYHHTKLPVKTLDDVEKLTFLFKNTTYYFIKENFKKGDEFFGTRGEPQFYVLQSGYQALAILWMGIENLVYALADYPEKIEALMKAIDDSYDNLYDEITNSGMVKIINFGENIDQHITPPRYFEKYCIPFYEKRVKQLQKAGVYTYVHIDGSVKSLLKYLKYLPFDGYEALTPVPQGDVEIEEIKEAIGDKVLLDGIPAVFFLSHHSLDELDKCVEKLIRLFHPRLVLGVSDEVPVVADIARVRYVSDKCKLKRGFSPFVKGG